ncbi:O-antigen ligase family protein [Candidatus Parcubacteria bacterium]|nr:O-antigen ligase family protein [Candidatus Parcubacteria bacterium]
MGSKFSSIHTAVTKYLLYSLCLVTPLLLTFSTYELFEFPKMIFVYLVAILLIALKLSQVVTTGTWPKLKRPTKFDLTILLFLGLNLLATFFSTHPPTSIFGYYTRLNGGLLSLGCYLVIYHTFRVELQKEGLPFLKKCLGLLVTAACLVSIYAWGQHFGLDKGMWVQDSQARAFSTLGQPNWLAAFLLLILPVILTRYLQTTKTRLRNLYFSLFALCFGAFWFTYSRAGLVGLLFSTLLLLVFTPRTLLKQHRKKLAFLTLMCLVIGLGQPGLFKEHLAKLVNRKLAVHATEPLGTTPEIKEVGGDTGRIRLLVWQGTLRLIADQPLLGTGPETFAYSFLPYRPAALNQTTEWDFLYNKAHNEYLNIAVNCGLPGLLVFLGIVWQTFRQAFKNRQNLTTVGLSCGLLGMLVANFFGFSVVTTSLLFWIYLAAISYRSTQ